MRTITRLPVETRLAVDRPDLPEYELNNYCAAPECHEAREYGGGHHIFRRSAGYPSWYVEMPDGEIVGNRVGLCPMHHHLVTVNKTRIILKHGLYWWVNEAGESWEMNWQPPTMHQKKEFLDPLFDPTTKDDLASSVEPGHDCPKCHRRVPLPKKETSPTTKVFSCRIPIDDAETFSEIVDAAAEYSGLKSKPHHVYNTLLVGLTLILQAPREDLPDVG